MKKNHSTKKIKNRKPDQRGRISLDQQLKKVSTGVQNGVFVYTAPLTLGEFAAQIGQSPSNLIKHFFVQGKIVNFNTLLTIEQIGELCLEFGMDFKIETEVTKENILDTIKFDDDESALKPRPPIVTIMGHVDHGKTSLLDVIRKTNVVASEHGGITQHIGAYQTSLNNQRITFIDTPGHEAFTDMRARGANLTDIVVLVVAADDGVKPQTEEAIDHAKNAKVPIVVFINKMDKPDANPERVMQQLTSHDLVPEAWGGSTIVVQGSAYTQQGIVELLQSILLLADINDYKANYDAQAYGIVIEANLSQTLGPLVSVIVKRGSLKVGDYVTLGASYGKVRTMQDEYGHDVAVATPSKPVKISGFDIVPEVGEKFVVLPTEQEVKAVADSYKQKLQRQKYHDLLKTEQIAASDLKNLDVILKTDVQGSLEAIKQAVAGLDVDGAVVNVIRAATGAINENDVKLAQASKGMIVGFNISCAKPIKEMIDAANVFYRNYNVIYSMLADLKKLLKGQLDPVFEDSEIGEAEVREIWKHSKIGTIAGCYVLNGKIKRNANCRVVRDGVVIYRSKIGSLKSFKDAVSEVLMDHECGLTVENFNDIKKADLIQVYEVVEKQQE